MQQQQQPTMQGRLLVLGGIAVLAAKLIALPALVYIRKDFGIRFLTLPWILGAFAVLQIVAAWTTDTGLWQAKQWEAAGYPLLPGMPYNGNAISIWGWIYLAGGLIRWLQTKRREHWHGEHLHTYYSGSPNTKNRKINVSNWRRFMEPLFVAFMGWTVYQHLDQPLGRWLGWTALACFLQEHFLWLTERRRLWDIRDPIYEQEYYAELLRESIRRDRSQDDPYIVRQPRRRGWFW